MTIDPGATAAPLHAITGAAVGTATITGTATGFGPSTVDITVTSSVISAGLAAVSGLGQARRDACPAR